MSNDVTCAMPGGDVASAVRDPERLEAVRRTGLLDSESEEVFDRLTRLAAKIVGAPVTFISLVDENRDFYKSAHGFAEPIASAREMSGPTFCHYAIQSPEPLVIEDTRADPVYRDVPTVHSIGVAAYLGVPLITSDAHAIGSFCAIDFKPRKWTPEQVEIVKELAQSALREIELRLEVTQRRKAEATQAELLERERAARAEAERRAVEEQALRRAAAAVTAAYTVDEASRQIVTSAVEAAHAQGAFIEHIDGDSGEIVVAAIAGNADLPLGARISYQGSFAERAVEEMTPILIPRIGAAERPLPGDLTTRYADWSGLIVPLLDSGSPIGTLVLLRDASQMGFLREEVDRAQTFADLAALAFRKIHLLEDSERRREELERITESRSRLMRGFSHDLKNPLGAVDGHAQLLEDEILGGLSERQRESVGRIRRLVRSALDLIEDLVELARAEAGQIEVEPAPTDVREVARDLADAYRAQMEGAGLVLETDFPGEFPLVRSDPSRVRQVLGNLISNAIKYNRPQGCVRVGARFAEDAEGGGRIAVWVGDTGEGIPRDKLGLLFREFSRLHPATTPGAGLGLAISQKIAAALGGEITVESTPGEGSTFTLWLPAERLADGG